MIRSRMSPVMADIILIISVLVASVTFILIFGSASSDTGLADIYRNGEHLAELDLSSPGESFRLEDGTVVAVDREGVFVQTSVCSDGFCKRTGHINRSGQTIICLPERIVIRIRGNSSGSEVDAVAG